jgi:hypothetical protein
MEPIGAALIAVMTTIVVVVNASAMPVWSVIPQMTPDVPVRRRFACLTAVAVWAVAAMVTAAATSASTRSA